MSLSKNVDLKCSETLRDSPPAPPPPPQLQLQPSLGNASVFASTVIAPSQNPPSHQSQHQSVPPLITTAPGSSDAAFGLSQQQVPTVSLLVRKFDPQRATSPVGRHPTTESANTGASPSGKSVSASAAVVPAPSLPFGIANVVSASKPSLSPHYSPQTQQSPIAFSSPQFSSLPFPSAATASVWPFVQQHVVLPSQLSSSPSKHATFASAASTIQSSPTKVQGATSATLPLSLSPSKGSSSGSSPTQGRPLTLHVSTSRGPAVLQLQQSTTSAGASHASGKQPVKLLSAPGLASPSHQSPQSTAVANAAAPTRPVVASLPPFTAVSMVGSAVPTRVPVLRPSPVHPVAAATAALLSQLAPNAPAFGLVDPHSHHLQQQHLQAAAAFLRSPLANPGTSAGTISGASVLPHVVAVNQQVPTQVNAAGSRSVIVPASGSQFSANATTMTGGISDAASAPGATSSAKGIHSAPSTPSTAASVTASSTITPSPTRPSILRKRMPDMSNGAGSGSPTAKRLAYEPVTLAKRANEKAALTPDSDSRPGTSMASTIVENPEAGNSNQSSSASTISAGSTADNSNGNGYSVNSSQATTSGVWSPSPRKRPRKQQLSELTSSRGYGSDDGSSTPILSYHCEAIEEETVVGPTGVGGMDGRYLPLASPQRSQLGQGSLLIPAMGRDIYDRYQSPSKRQSVTAEYAKSSSLHLSVSQRQTLSYERPSTSFDQLQQQIEQQRKHVPEYRPRPSLLAQYELPYDSRRYHFAVQEDMRAREEKRPSMVELSNQKQILQRIGGWKAQLMAVQFSNVDREERTNLEDLSELYELLNSWTSIDAGEPVSETDFPDAEERREIEMLKEMVLTNTQRVRVIREQLDDGKKQLLSLLKHRDKVEKLIQRYTTKRSVRTKDRSKTGPYWSSDLLSV